MQNRGLAQYRAPFRVLSENCGAAAAACFVITELFKENGMRIRKLFTRRELLRRKKRLSLMLGCIAAVVVAYIIITWPEKAEPEPPLVAVEPVGVKDVEIYGDYTLSEGSFLPANNAVKISALTAIKQE